MSTKFFCNNERCHHVDKGPFVLELSQEAVMDGNNMATIFCPRCGKPMKQLPLETKLNDDSHRFYCHNEICSNQGGNLFYIDLPGGAILDKNNMATIFCPKCGKEMTSFDHEPTVVVNY